MSRKLIVGVAGNLSREQGERLKAEIAERLGDLVDDVLVISQCSALLLLDDGDEGPTGW